MIGERMLKDLEKVERSIEDAISAEKPKKRGYVFMGSGSSYNVAEFARLLALENGFNAHSFDNDTYLFYRFPKLAPSIIISVSGGKDSIAMAKHCKRFGKAYLVTCNKNAKAKAFVDKFFYVTERENWFINTRSVIANLTYFLSLYTEKEPEINVNKKNARKIARFLTKENKIWFVGKDYSKVIAEQAEIKFREVLGVHTNSCGPGEFFHGRVFHKLDSIFVLLNPLEKIRSFLEENGMKVVQLEFSCNPEEAINSLAFLYHVLAYIAINKKLNELPLLKKVEEVTKWAK